MWFWWAARFQNHYIRLLECSIYVTAMVHWRSCQSVNCTAVTPCGQTQNFSEDHDTLLVYRIKSYRCLQRLASLWLQRRPSGLCFACCNTNTINWKKRKKVKSLSHVRLFATSWTVAHQTPPSNEFYIKSTGVGCHFILQGIFPAQDLNPGLLHCGQTVWATTINWVAYK